MTFHDSNFILHIPLDIIYHMENFLTPGNIVAYARTHRESQSAMHYLKNVLRKPKQVGFEITLCREYSEIVMNTINPDENFTWLFVDRQRMNQKLWSTEEEDTYGVSMENKIICVFEMLRRIREVYPAPVQHLLINTNVLSSACNAMETAEAIVELQEVEELYIMSVTQEEPEFQALEYILANLKVLSTVVSVGSGCAGLDWKKFPNVLSIPKKVLTVSRRATAKQIMEIAVEDTHIYLPQVSVEFCNQLLHLWVNSNTTALTRLSITSSELSETRRWIFRNTIFKGFHLVRGSQDDANPFRNNWTSKTDENVSRALRNVGIPIKRGDGSVLTFFLKTSRDGVYFVMKAEYSDFPDVAEHYPSLERSHEKLFESYRQEQMKVRRAGEQLHDSVREFERAQAEGIQSKFDRAKSEWKLNEKRFPLIKETSEWKRDALRMQLFDVKLDLDFLDNTEERLGSGYFLPHGPFYSSRLLSTRNWISSFFS